MMLLICLMQQHVMATCILANATLEVARNKLHILLPGVADSSDNEEPDWRDLLLEVMD
jgi:hypothetical protein